MDNTCQVSASPTLLIFHVKVLTAQHGPLAIGFDTFRGAMRVERSFQAAGLTRDGDEEKFAMMIRAILSTSVAALLFLSTTPARAVGSVKSEICDVVEVGAREGDSRYQAMLGTCYLHGNGREEDLNEAIRWFRKSVSQGDVNGYQNLASAYLFELGDPEKHNEAIHLLEVSHSLGSPNAPFVLAVVAMNGWGMDSDLSVAVEYLDEAVRNGHEIACHTLKELAVSCPLLEKNCEPEDKYGAAAFFTRDTYLADEFVQKYILESVEFIQNCRADR
jgi:hypothetical protein